MNLLRLGPNISMERPLTPDEFRDRRHMMLVPRLEELEAEFALAREMAVGVMEEMKLERTKTEARWRQVSFHSEQIDRLYGPQESDPTRRMVPEMAAIHEQQLLIHLTRLGIVEEVQLQPYPEPVPAAETVAGPEPRGFGAFAPVPALG